MDLNVSGYALTMIENVLNLTRFHLDITELVPNMTLFVLIKTDRSQLWPDLPKYYYGCVLNMAGHKYEWICPK